MNTGRVLRRAVPTALVLASAAFAMPAYAGEAEDVAALRAAASKYTDVKVAVADGFTATDVCVESPEGVMGYHYVNASLMGAPPTVTKPPILVYQPDGKGGRKLVAVEYLKADADQNLATSDDKPSLFGRPFDGPMEGHEPGMPKHYDLHAWLWQDNPKGMFTAFNPAGSCKVGQVSETPSGGASTGDGSTAGTEQGWLFALGGSAAAAGAVVLVSGRRTATRKN